VLSADEGATVVDFCVWLVRVTVRLALAMVDLAVWSVSGTRVDPRLRRFV
jgi:hypothetical protein